MAVPGFSVTDLIQAVGHIKTVYDGFFDKYTNSVTQVRNLADHIWQFQTNLEAHKEIIQSRGLEYSGYVAIKRTLDECEDFLNKYKAVLDKKSSMEKLWKTGRYQYEQDTVARLQKQIESHGINILHFNMNILLQDRLHRENTVAPHVLAQALDIPSRQSQSVITLPPPSLLSESPRALGESRLSISPGRVSPQSPKWVPTSGSGSGQGSPRSPRSPESRPLISQPQVDLDLQNQNSDVVLQPPLDYCVAKVYIGEKKTKPVAELRRKAKGRNIPKARELLIFNEKGEPRLRHQIKLGTRQSCYPYTWHSMWDRDLEVTFMGLSLEAHSVKFYERTASPGIPSYVFTEHKDYMEFQSQVRGEQLIDYFDFDKIGTASSQKEATDQHLKIWKNRITQQYSISFYASAAKNPIDLEFPIAMFTQEIKPKDGIKLNLDFLIAEETKPRIFKKPSRSSTGKSVGSSSMSTSASSIFSQKPTLKNQMTFTTVADSRMSVISTSSENSQTQTDEVKNGMSPLEARAKKMKFINIDFSHDDEADRFRKLYDKAYKEEASRALEYFRNWQLGTDPSQRPEGNMSPPETPFMMSPELRGQASPVLRPQR